MTAQTKNKNNRSKTDIPVSQMATVRGTLEYKVLSLFSYL